MSHDQIVRVERSAHVPEIAIVCDVGMRVCCVCVCVCARVCPSQDVNDYSHEIKPSITG